MYQTALPPPRNILLGETLYLGLNPCTRSAPAPCNVDLGPGTGSGVYCAYCSYGDMAIGVTDNGQVMAGAVLASECVCVFIFMISKLTGSQCSSGAKFSKHILKSGPSVSRWLVCFLMLCVMGVAQGLAARPHH